MSIDKLKKVINGVSTVGNMNTVYSLEKNSSYKSNAKRYSYQEVVDLINTLKKDIPNNVVIGFKSRKESSYVSYLISTRENNLKDMVDKDIFKNLNIYEFKEKELRSFYDGDIKLTLVIQGFIFSSIYYQTEEEAIKLAKYITNRYGDYFPEGVRVNRVLLWSDGSEARKDIIKVVE